MSEPTQMTVREMFDMLCEVGDRLATVHGRAGNLSPEAALAVGYALGAVLKARSHAARDIDTQNDTDAYLVWSHEHSAWWNPDDTGYTPRLCQAGRMSRSEAMRICIRAMPGAHAALNELPVRLQDVLEMAAAYQTAYGDRPERWQ